VLARALKAGKPVVVEKLDFRAKKAQLEEVAAGRSRILSALAYRQFYQLLAAACFRAGVELTQVSPAYTSVIGAINHAQILRFSVHIAAAFVIARRGLNQKLTEAPRASIVRDGAWVPTRNGDHVTFPLPARNRRKHVWSQWSGARRRLCAAHEEHRRCGKGNLDPPPLSQLRAQRSSPASRATGGFG
jgi:IS605 OrfB family transposase